MSRTGGRILVDQLALHGAGLAFGVPGESYIDVLDALRDSPVRYVTCRHEGGAVQRELVDQDPAAGAAHRGRAIACSSRIVAFCGTSAASGGSR